VPFRVCTLTSPIVVRDVDLNIAPSGKESIGGTGRTTLNKKISELGAARKGLW